MCSKPASASKQPFWILDYQSVLGWLIGDSFVWSTTVEDVSEFSYCCGCRKIFEFPELAKFHRTP